MRSIIIDHGRRAAARRDRRCDRRRRHGPRRPSHGRAHRHHGAAVQGCHPRPGVQLGVGACRALNLRDLGPNSALDEGERIGVHIAGQGRRVLEPPRQGDARADRRTQVAIGVDAVGAHELGVSDERFVIGRVADGHAEVTLCLTHPMGFGTQPEGIRQMRGAHRAGDASSKFCRDALYSGTVAAAIEGRYLGFPAIAVSQVSSDPKHFETAAEIACRLVLRLQSKPLPIKTILNVNVPDLPLQEIRGVEITRLGTRHGAEPTIKSVDPRGHTIYWVGPPGEQQDAGVGTDFYAVSNSRVSITPLQLDFTHYSIFNELSNWTEALI